MNNWLHFKIAYQTIKDNWKITIILMLLFMGMGAMYSGMYPAFEDVMLDMSQDFSESFGAFRGSEDLATYIGFLNIELYQIFWLLVLGILLGIISASSISKEIEGKTIDLLMSNPVSRKQIIFEKFSGLIPMVLIINFATMLVVYLVTILIDEEINFGYLAMTHVFSIPYFLAIIAIGILISVLFNERMKASIIMIAIVIGMFVLQSISLMIPDYENLGVVSLTHYFDPYPILKSGEVDVVGTIVLLVICSITILLTMIYFEHKDIEVS